MKHTLIFHTLPLVLAALFASPALAADAAQPDADQILRQTSAKLAAARQFSFHAHRHSHGAVLPGRALPEDAQIEVTVQRPNGIVAKSVSTGDVRHVYFDGHNLTMVDGKKNFYATVPERTSIDGLLARIETKYGFMPPLGELAAGDMYEDIRHKAQAVSWLGRSYHACGFLGLAGEDCDRVLLSGKAADTELWVAVKDQLPRKMIVTFKKHPGQPRLTADLSQWDLTPKVSPADFVFHPPKGALKIPMLTTAEMKAQKNKPAAKTKKAAVQTAS